MNNFSKIKNIIFDLGGVLFKLNGQNTINEFTKAGIKNAEKMYNQINYQNLFDDFETGMLSAEQFRQKMNSFTGIEIDMKTFEKCWNVMITDYPIENNILLNNLSKKFNLYVLSNTNEIHVRYFEPIANWPKDLFKGIYYSNQIHYKKPNVECFKHVVNNLAKINPTETIFIDDRLDNIEGAKKANLNTIHLPKQEMIYQIFKDYMK